MKRGLWIGSILLILGFAVLIPPAEAVSIWITPQKNTFYYGDHLAFTVEVSEITGNLATLYIIDETGKRSSPIPFPISQLKTEQSSPFPFEKMTYPEGKWVLEIEYEGTKNDAEFLLKDSGQIVIPLWIKDVGKMWANDLITGEQYATALEFLIKQNIIIIPEKELSGEKKENVIIPAWIKTSTAWWTEGIISDHDYGTSIEFLIKAGIIVV